MMQNNQVRARRRPNRRRQWFNVNHLIKSQNGNRRLAGFKRKRRYRRRRVNPGHRNTRRLLEVSPPLEAVIGVDRATRADIVRLIWQYVRNNNLKNPENGRFFRPDEQLATVLGREGEYINGFTILGQLKYHYRPIWTPSNFDSNNPYILIPYFDWIMQFLIFSIFPLNFVKFVLQCKCEIVVKSQV